MGKQVIIVQTTQDQQPASSLAFPERFATAVSTIYASDIARLQASPANEPVGVTPATPCTAQPRPQ